MDVSTDSPAGRWMTLKELAGARHISVSSAARLMRRRRWRRQPGNDGHIRVLVPADEQEPAALVSKEGARPDISPDDRADDRPDVIADIRTGVMEVIRPLQEAITALRLQLDEANARAARAEQAVAGERVRADVLRDRLDEAQRKLQQAQDAADAVRQAEMTRQRTSRWRRALASWRGE